MWLKKQRGHDQHAAITTIITTSLTTSSPRLDLGVCGSGRGLGRAGGGIDCRPVARHSKTPSTPLQSPRGGPGREPCPSHSDDGAAVTTELLDLGARPGTTSRVSCPPRQLCEQPARAARKTRAAQKARAARATRAARVRNNCACADAEVEDLSHGIYWIDVMIVSRRPP